MPLVLALYLSLTIEMEQCLEYNWPQYKNLSQPGGNTFTPFPGHDDGGGVANVVNISSLAFFFGLLSFNADADDDAAAG